METNQDITQFNLLYGNRRIKPIALYFPQLHAIPENDKWWGKGFTDWDNVKRAKPQFNGHNQPRIPQNSNYYDQSKLETLEWQIELAKAHNLFGFCHYHYWFDGKQLLETPTNLMLSNKHLDFPFCLSWANETWSKRWDGQDHHILIQQTHPPVKESWKKHYDYLIKIWTDPRAIKVNGKPVFIIYRPQRIEKIDEMLAYWQDLAIKDGLPGLYFIFQKQYELPSRKCLASFDAAFQFQPFESIYTPSFDRSTIKYTVMSKLLAKLSKEAQDYMRGLPLTYLKFLTFYDYDAVWKRIIEVRPDDTLPTYPGAFMDWDNTARYRNRATIFTNANPQSFEIWFSKLVATMPQRNLPENFIFINAWNEWSEGTYLEPDVKYGYQYIEAVKHALKTNSD